MALSFALDFLSWNCLSKHWVDTARFGIGCENKPSIYANLVLNYNDAFSGALRTGTCVNIE